VENEKIKDALGKKRTRSVGAGKGRGIDTSRGHGVRGMKSRGKPEAIAWVGEVPPLGEEVRKAGGPREKEIVFENLLGRESEGATVGDGYRGDSEHLNNLHENWRA